MSHSYVVRNVDNGLVDYGPSGVQPSRIGISSYFSEIGSDTDTDIIKMKFLEVLFRVRNYSQHYGGYTLQSFIDACLRMENQLSNFTYVTDVEFSYIVLLLKTRWIMDKILLDFTPHVTVDELQLQELKETVIKC